MILSTNNDNYYCSRRLGEALIPGSDGKCGSDSGPQCPDCRGNTKASMAAAAAGMRIGVQLFS